MRQPVTIHELAERTSGRIVGARDDGTEADETAQVLVDATHDSRQVGPGWLYACVPGAKVDGHDFAAQAAAQGAAALLVERTVDVAIPQVLVPNVRAALGPAAALVHGDPSELLTVVGVTGTNGKSSIVQLLADIWNHVGTPSEIVGTLVGSRTTPEATDLARIFRNAVDRGVQAMAVEVSSHALAMGRVSATRFAASVFTNLTRDHLDFHPTMEDYFEAKARLFRSDLSTAGVINADDAWGRQLLDPESTRPLPIPLHAFSLDDAQGLDFVGATSDFTWRGNPVKLKLAGAHNVSNALAAARVGELLGIDAAKIAEALCVTAPVRGRFEAVDAGQAFHVAVDYAHTPDGLRAALQASRQVVSAGRVIVVFGCGGERDTEKRSEMGEVAEQLADLVVVTSDNPRSEEPAAIIDEILGGMAQQDVVQVEPDREAAINLAIRQAKAGDLVLIAGKGHETLQIIGDQTIEFDDRRVALQALGVAS